MASLSRGFKRSVAWWSRTALFRRVGPTVMPPLERGMTWLTRGRVPLSGLLVPSLVLYSMGAKSGIERETTLMYCPDGEGQMLVTGSNFARTEHPAWSTNLLAHPDAVVRVRGDRIEVRATLVADDERESTWRTLERQWPGYRSDERTAGRMLRIFRLDPR